MKYFKKLVGKKCYLSPISTEDFELWAKWDNDLEVGILAGEEAYAVFSIEKEKEVIGKWAKDDSPAFSIISSEDDRCVGKIGLHYVDSVNRSASFGIMIGEKEYWNKGIGTEAVKLLLDFSFNLLNLNSMMLGVFDFNKRAIESYRKIGFKEIGRKREARIIAGKKYDLILMNMLASEFESPVISKVMENLK